VSQARSFAVLGLITAAIMAAVGMASSGRDGWVREFRGVLIAEFEGDTFVEGATDERLPALGDSNHGYLDLDSITLPADPCSGRAEGAVPERREAFAIRFVGRRKAGPAGHLGMSPAEYQVDRVIDIRPIRKGC
jgi:hypothetical protein